MDKSADSAIYDEFKDHIDQVTESDGTKVLQTRLLKLSVSDDDKEYSYAAIGRELFESGQFQKSLAPLKKVLIINPLNEDAQLNLAKALFKLEKEDEAFSAIKKALSLRPESCGLHSFLVEKLEEKDRLADLESVSKEIIEMIDDQKSTPVFYRASGMALLEQDRLPQALVTYRKGTKDDTQLTYENHYDYGCLLYYSGLFEEALVQFEHAKSLNPDSKSTVNYIALLNYCVGRVEKAKEEFEHILQSGLEINTTQANLYLVLAHIDENSEATQQYRDSLKQFITPEGSHIRLRLVEQLELTQGILERDDIDEKTKEFNEKKLKAINFVLSA